MAAKQKKGLGTGLDVLFGQDEEKEQELQTVPISSVEPRQGQPRMYFNEEALQELADSITKYGLIQPITVRKLDGGYFQIIAGERRWRASRLAGLKEVPVRIIEADDRKTAELALVENLQREDLNPIEEARGYKSLIEEYGLTQEEAAKSVGRSRSAVANTMRLLSLSDEVSQMVERGELSAGHARALLPISSSEEQLKAAKEVVSKNYSVRRTEKLAADALKAKEEPEEKKDDVIRVDYAKVVSDDLTKKLGRKVRLIEGRKNGRIEIDYYGADDREELIALLMGKK